MRLAILFSGGKDSTYAAYLASKEHKIVCLLSMISKNPDSYMFHTPNINLTTIQAKVMNLPLLTQSTSGEKEIEVKELKRLVQAAKRKYKIEGVVTGAIKSTYQATRIQKVCHELNLWCFNPLWQKDEITHLKDLIKNKFEVIISAVAAYPFDENWLGRKLTIKTIRELEELQEKYQVNSCGEGGEYESLVVKCPLFKKRLEIKKTEIIYHNYAGILHIKEVKVK